VEPKAKIMETISVKDAAEKIKVIREGLMQTLKTLREKLGTFEADRADLMSEIETLKKDAESRVDALEDEVGQLREEVRSLRELLGSAERSA
jgi:uncharacterized coiled-coil DUF342 family protein